MRTLRMAALSLTLALIALALGAPQMPGALAQAGDQCLALAEQAVAEALAACGELAPGEICYGGGVTAESLPQAIGDRAALADVASLTTAAADPEAGEWGLALVQFPADLAGSEGSITGVLFGEVQLGHPAEAVAAAEAHPTLTVRNPGSIPVNVRSGAGLNFAVVSQLAAGAEATADGRNAAGDWVRLVLPDLTAWAFAPLLGWEGDQSAAMTLDVLAPEAPGPDAQPDTAVYAVTLITGEAPCAAAPSGLLLQHDGDPAALEVNGVRVAITQGTVLLTARPGEALEVSALDGAATVSARGTSREIVLGSGVSVALGGADGLTPQSAPQPEAEVAFQAVAYAPLGLLPAPTACAVGLPSAEADVTLRVGPGEQRGVLAAMRPNRSYEVIGWANDPTGSPWFELNTGTQSAWAPQAEVLAVGACEMVAEVEAPPLVFAAPAAPPPAPDGAGTDDAGAAPVAGDFAPAAQSVWQMIPGSDNMTGECTGAPAINFCDHLAAISPAQGGIMWRGMEPSPYYLTQIQPNVYAYSGPNVVGTGTVNMTLSFTSDSAVRMTMSMVLASEPNCQHVYYYTGTKNW